MNRFSTKILQSGLMACMLAFCAGRNLHAQTLPAGTLTLYMDNTVVANGSTNQTGAPIALGKSLTVTFVVSTGLSGNTLGAICVDNISGPMSPNTVMYGSTTFTWTPVVRGTHNITCYAYQTSGATSTLSIPVY